jgi:adenylate cyclase
MSELVKKSPREARGRPPPWGTFSQALSSQYRQRGSVLFRTGAIVALLCGAVSWSAFQYIPVLAGLEYWVGDVRYLWLGKRYPQNNDIIVLAVGENTLAELPYRSPLDRGLLADLINVLNDKGAKAVVVDLLVDQQTEVEKDKRLITALKHSRIPVTLAWVTPDQEKRLMTERQRRWFHALVEGAGVTTGIIALSGTDAWGIVRWMPPGVETSQGRTEGLPLAVLHSLGIDRKPGNPAIHYRLPQDAGLPVFPVYEVRPHLMRQFPPKDWVEGKIVLIGAVRPFEDRHQTPLNALSPSQAGGLPGVLIFAHAMAQLLDGSEPSLQKPLPALGSALGLALLGSLLAGVHGYLPAALRLGAALSLYGTFNGLAFAVANLSLPVISPILAFVFSYGLQTARLGRKYRQQKRFIKNAFSHYLAPQVIDALLEKPDVLKLGGETRELTFLFSDIAGFTTLSESMPPAVLAGLMNEYLDGMVNILFRYQGTLDKFVGDAIVCFFGAPHPQSDQAEKAVRCAIEMDCFAQRFACRQKRAGTNFGVTRLGVHTGVALVGNFGASKQFNYTVLGDAVNTAARLEGANKYLGTRICVSETTMQRCEPIEKRFVAELMLKGKTQSLPVWEPLAEGADPISYLGRYEEAIRLLKNGDVPTAAILFKALHEQYPDDALVASHHSRLTQGEADLKITLTSK